MTERDNPGVIALPPLIMAAAVAVSAGLEFLFPLTVLPPAFGAVAAIVGAVLLVGGVAIAITGMRAFRRAGTNVEPFKPALVLVEDGPYRFTRNPMYIGLILVHLGITVAASLDWGVPLAVVLFVVLHKGVVLREEAYLKAKFGAPYEAFLARTRRWI